MAKNLVSILDVREHIMDIIELAEQLKEKTRTGVRYTPMEGMTLGMIFEKPSTRTRLSFEVGATQLGGHAIYMGKNDLQLGRGESISDTAKVMSRYLDIIMYRAFKHAHVRELSQNSSVPVINALDDREHPCQILADLLTIYEKKLSFADIKLAYVGDGNNVCNSLLLGAAAVGLDMSVATPPNYTPPRDIIEKAMSIAEETNTTIEVHSSPGKAVLGADVIYTDVWISMGDEAAAAKKTAIFTPYQVNDELVEHADDEYIFMHCLPAHRGMEVTDAVMDSPHSVVFDQAENRLHAQKALMLYLLGLVKL